MTWNELIVSAQATAMAGTDADVNPIRKQRLEAGAMTDQALQALATVVAGSPELRARLEKQFSVTLTSGHDPRRNAGVVFTRRRSPGF